MPSFLSTPNSIKTSRSGSALHRIPVPGRAIPLPAHLGGQVCLSPDPLWAGASHSWDLEGPVHAPTPWRTTPQGEGRSSRCLQDGVELGCGHHRVCQSAHSPHRKHLSPTHVLSPAGPDRPACPAPSRPASQRNHVLLRKASSTASPAHIPVQPLLTSRSPTSHRLRQSVDQARSTE